MAYNMFSVCEILIDVGEGEKYFSKNKYSWSICDISGSKICEQEIGLNHLVLLFTKSREFLLSFYPTTWCWRKHYFWNHLQGLSPVDYLLLYCSSHRLILHFLLFYNEKNSSVVSFEKLCLREFFMTDNQQACHCFVVFY